MILLVPSDRLFLSNIAHTLFITVLNACIDLGWPGEHFEDFRANTKKSALTIIQKAECYQSVEEVIILAAQESTYTGLGHAVMFAVSGYE
jgi:hypothetical protein